MRAGMVNKRVVCLLTALVFAAGCSMPLAPEVAWAKEAPATQDESAAQDWSAQIPQMLEAGEYEDGTVVVCMQKSTAKKGAGKSDLLAGAEEIMTLDTAAAQDDATGIIKKGASRAGAEELTLTAIRNKNLTTGQLLEKLAKDDRVLFAEPNYITEVEPDKNTQAAENASEDAPESSPVAEPGTVAPVDDMTAQQWSSSETAEFHVADKNVAGKNVAGKNKEVSMKIPGFGPTGSNMTGEPIVVAVNDTAVDFSHPDLADVAYTFSPEAQARLGCDEHGYNAIWQSKDGRLTYYPDNAHGSHCAGILGANWDGHGISGVASNVKIVSVQIMKDDNYTSLINGLRAFAFIKRANEEANANIRITSNSWSLLQYSKALNAAVKELGESQGVVSIFAAGNDTADLPQVNKITKGLKDNPYAIIVASTNPNGDLSYFSEYSDQIVDMGAPGSAILSCYLTGENELTYIPDAVKESNKFYEGFETGEPAVGVDIIDAKNAKAGAGRVTGDEGMVFAGHHSMCLDLNRAVPITEDDGTRTSGVDED